MLHSCSQECRSGSFDTDAQISVSPHHTANADSRSASSHICNPVEEELLIGFTLLAYAPTGTSKH